jgi:glycosyltransferase involved in cell wall biosynthesis
VKIALIASHAWPIPNAARTGDVYVLDLAKGLEALGHDVTMFAPAGTQFTNVWATKCAFGKTDPTPLEHDTLRNYRHDLLDRFDIVHDHSTTKVIAHHLADHGRPVCMTLTGGPWRDAKPPVNLCVFSESQRLRVLRGATDYEGSPTPDMGGPPGRSVTDASVVPAGVDTDFYCPSDYTKDDYALWLNRWHPVKGYELAARIARETGLKLVMAGVHPDDTTNDHERQCAFEARELARDVPSIDFRWLPGTNPEHDEAKRELYRRARCLLYTTMFQEPFGLSMVEAMACGTPVVGSRMGSVPEIVQRGRGFICNLDAETVTRFKELADFTFGWGPPAYAVCRNEAAANFSQDAFARRYLDEYQRIVKGTPLCAATSSRASRASRARRTSAPTTLA